MDYLNPDVQPPGPMRMMVSVRRMVREAPFLSQPQQHRQRMFTDHKSLHRRRELHILCREGERKRRVRRRQRDNLHVRRRATAAAGRPADANSFGAFTKAVVEVFVPFDQSIFVTAPFLDVPAFEWPMFAQQTADGADVHDGLARG